MNALTKGEFSSQPLPWERAFNPPPPTFSRLSLAQWKEGIFTAGEWMIMFLKGGKLQLFWFVLFVENTNRKCKAPCASNRTGALPTILSKAAILRKIRRGGCVCVCGGGNHTEYSSSISKCRLFKRTYESVIIECTARKFRKQLGPDSNVLF